MEEKEETFSGLLALARAGDRDARERLLRPHVLWVERRVRRRLDRRLRSRCDALDVAQEVFLGLLRRLPRLHDRGEAAFRSLLVLMADNTVRTLLRRHLGRDGRRREPPAGDCLDRVDPRGTRGPEIEDAEECAKLRRLLRELPATSRSILEARAAGLAYEEIASARGLASAEAVRKRRARLLVVLRRRWGADVATPRESASGTAPMSDSLRERRAESDVRPFPSEGGPVMRSASRFLLATAAMAIAAGSASAWYVGGLGLCNAVVGSPGAGPFNTILSINPNAGAYGVGSAGDVILGVEEGRDNNSHYATLGVWLSPQNPFVGVLTGAGVVPPVDGTYFAPPPGGVLIQIVYRATNDPLNPGWAALPGGAAQVADDVAACHAVAEQMTSFRASAAAGLGGVGANWPRMDIETDINPINPSFFEFYKYRAIH